MPGPASERKRYTYRNQFKPLKCAPAQTWRTWAGNGVRNPSDCFGGGTPGPGVVTGREGPVKACGVAGSMLQGYSWVPTFSTGKQ